MLSLSIRNLLAHKLRFVMTTFAVVLGVGFVVGAFVVTDTLRGSVDTLFLDTQRGVDVSVRAESALGLQASRDRVPLEVADRVADVEGVAVVQPTVGGYAQLLTTDGEPVTTTGAPLLGVSWGVEGGPSPVTVGEGRGPERAGEVAIDRGTAEDFGFTVGDRTSVLLPDGQQEVEIVGIFTFGETNSLLGARLTAFDLGTALEVFADGAGYDAIEVVSEPGVAPDELAARIGEVLPEGVEAITATQVVDESSREVGQFLSVFQNALLAFAAIALFVSAFYINNTYAIVLGQRVKELALLRALGATSEQIRTSVLLESVVVGLLASALGVVAGLGIAGVLRSVLAAGGFELPPGSLVIAPRTLLAAAVVGLGVTVASAVLPARHAAQVAPVEGMREGYRPPQAALAVRIAVGVSLSALGLVLVGLGLTVIERVLYTFVAFGVGALALFVGVAVLSPVVARPVVQALAAPVARAFGPTGRMARSNAARDPLRTSRTAAALMVGLALVTTVFIVGTSLKASFAASVERAVQADYVVSTESFTGFSPRLAAGLDELAEVGPVTGVRFDRFLFEGSTKDLVAADPRPAGQLVDIDVVAGSLDDLDDGSIFVHRDPARDLGLDVGDTVTVEMASGGPQELRVAGIHADSTYAGNYFVSLALFERSFPANRTDMLVFASAAEGVDQAEARAAIEAALEPYPQVRLEDRAEFNQSQQAQIDQMLVAVNALLGLALFIALLGIANTLALSVVERTREIGLLRAVGMSRRQTRRMITLESGIVAVFGAVLGVSLGLLFGLAAASAMPDSVITTVAVPVAALAVIVVQASLFGMLAGLLPARRAARLDVLRAIASE